MEHNFFTPGNYYYNGVGHVTVDYADILANGFTGVIERVKAELGKLSPGDADYAERHSFLEAVLICCEAVGVYAARYAAESYAQSRRETNPVRKKELERISENCARVPMRGARDFYEACQSFWFVQMLLQIESSGHSISPGRFDRYMLPYYEKSMKSGMPREFAQELMDCIWVKLNDLNKARDAVSAEGFAGYSLFQNLIAGGQTPGRQRFHKRPLFHVHICHKARHAPPAVVLCQSVERLAARLSHKSRRAYPNRRRTPGVL